MPRTPHSTDPNAPIRETQSFVAKPLTRTEHKERSAGRPPKLAMPDMPLMPLTDPEQALFDFFLEAHRQQYPDLTPTDNLMLWLAGIEFIKYLRVVAEELETGKVISMARQHPGVQMRALLDQLSTTRKARTAGKQAENPEEKELRDFFLGLSAPKARRTRAEP